VTPGRRWGPPAATGGRPWAQRAPTHGGATPPPPRGRPRPRRGGRPARAPPPGEGGCARPPAVGGAAAGGAAAVPHEAGVPTWAWSSQHGETTRVCLRRHGGARGLSVMQTARVRAASYSTVQYTESCNIAVFPILAHPDKNNLQSAQLLSLVRGRIRPDGCRSCICSTQLFLSGSAKSGETVIFTRGSTLKCFPPRQFYNFHIEILILCCWTIARLSRGHCNACR